MTTISAKVVADSISPEGVRLTTMELVYPRFIHSEFMTHRAFSRNASSSRAIPVERQIQMILDDPAVPLYWGRNQPGMQAREELGEDDKWHAQRAWKDACTEAVKQARLLYSYSAHKQIVNRVLEPFAHIKVLVTATEWENFFQLRLHTDAEPHMQMLARAMFDALAYSPPGSLASGQWHLPYVTIEDHMSFMGMKSGEIQETWAHTGFDAVNRAALARSIKISVARCARVSYWNHDGTTPSPNGDLALYDRLVGAVPLHASPCEHQATPDRNVGSPEDGDVWSKPKLWGNFKKWVQYRKLLEHDLAVSAL